MTFRMIAAAALLTVLSGSAFGGDESAPPAPVAESSCNYLDNALIGTRCAGTFSVGAGLQTTLRDVGADHLDNAPGVFNADARRQSPFEFFTVTPVSWLTLRVSSEYTDIDASASFVRAVGSGGSAEQHLSFFDRQTVSANINVIDTGSLSARYVVNVFAGDAYVPEHDRTASDNRAFVGYTSSAKWQLSLPNISLNWGSQLEAAFFTDRDVTILYSTSRMLLADDALGIAFGPVFESDFIAQGGNTRAPDSAYRAGAEVIAQPFKDSSSALLSGLVLDASVTRSIGQAGFVNKDFDARETVASGSARFNYKY
jgi:hypothetical protein